MVVWWGKSGVYIPLSLLLVDCFAHTAHLFLVPYFCFLLFFVFCCVSKKKKKKKRKKISLTPQSGSNDFSISPVLPTSFPSQDITQNGSDFPNLPLSALLSPFALLMHREYRGTGGGQRRRGRLLTLTRGPGRGCLGRGLGGRFLLSRLGTEGERRAEQAEMKWGTRRRARRARRARRVRRARRRGGRGGLCWVALRCVSNKVVMDGRQSCRHGSPPMVRRQRQSLAPPKLFDRPNIWDTPNILKKTLIFAPVPRNQRPSGDTPSPPRA